MTRLSLLALTLTVAPAHASGSARSPLRAFSGAPTRVVWVQNAEPSQPDPFARGTRLRLMGYDSEDGRRERAILERTGSFHKPLFSADGERVIFTDHRDRSVWIVGFDGTGLRRLATGRALEVWREARGGREWFYVLSEDVDAEWFSGRDVARCLLDAPRRCEPVYAGEMVMDNFQLSADGTRASGLFPWPRGGVLDLRTGTTTEYAEGCWTALAPDDSYLQWTFDTSHRNAYVTDTRSGRGWWVALNDAPGIDGHEVYHPRWSNSARIMTLTGPYVEPGRGRIRVFGGGRGVEVYVGRFNARYNDLEWHQVTHNRYGDFYPDVWVAPRRELGTGGQWLAHEPGRHVAQPAPAGAYRACCSQARRSCCPPDAQ